MQPSRAHAPETGEERSGRERSDSGAETKPELPAGPLWRTVHNACDRQRCGDLEQAPCLEHAALQVIDKSDARSDEAHACWMCRGRRSRIRDARNRLGKTIKHTLRMRGVLGPPCGPGVAP